MARLHRGTATSRRPARTPRGRGQPGAQRSAPTPCRVDKKRPGARGTLPPPQTDRRPRNAWPACKCRRRAPSVACPRPAVCVFLGSGQGGGTERVDHGKGGESRGESKHSTQRASESERGSLASLQQCSRGQGRAGHFACRVRGRYYIDGPQPRPENTHPKKMVGVLGVGLAPTRHCWHMTCPCVCTRCKQAAPFRREWTVPSGSSSPVVRPVGTIAALQRAGLLSRLERGTDGTDGVGCAGLCAAAPGGVIAAGLGRPVPASAAKGLGRRCAPYCPLWRGEDGGPGGPVQERKRTSEPRERAELLPGLPRERRARCKAPPRAALLREGRRERCWNAHAA